MTIIKPDEIYCDYVDDVVVTGFRQGDYYFIIQRDSSINEFHIELNDQSQGCYSGLSEIKIFDDRIVFQLNSLGQDALNAEAVVISDYIKLVESKKVVSELESIASNIKA